MVDLSKSDSDILERIRGYHERMSQFGAKDYYEKQIAQEEELLSHSEKLMNLEKSSWKS